jgi:RNA-directed DNA polymerase
VGFEHLGDAKQFLRDLRERLAKFNLELHPDKTRLIEFGRYAARNRKARGLGKPETFTSLGSTHICARGKNGGFWVKRITISKRMRAQLAEVKDQLKRRRYLPIPEQGKWLGTVMRGHVAYYAVPGNSKAAQQFRTQATRFWCKSLRRRSQRHRLTWARMGRIAQEWLPPARIQHHSHPCASPLRPEAGAQCGSSARWDLCVIRPMRTLVRPKLRFGPLPQL